MSTCTKRRVDRIIEQDPCFTCFKPAYGGRKNKEEVEIRVDEYEAMRLSDMEGLTMQQGAKKMGVSAPTFNRMLTAARKKISDAIVNGKTINIYTCCIEKLKTSKK